MKINTTGGQIHGITQDGLDIFLGIPLCRTTSS